MDKTIPFKKIGKLISENYWGIPLFCKIFSVKQILNMYWKYNADASKVKGRNQLDVSTQTPDLKTTMDWP